MSLEGSEEDSECSIAASKHGHYPAFSVGFIVGHLSVVVEIAPRDQRFLAAFLGRVLMGLAWDICLSRSSHCASDLSMVHIVYAWAKGSSERDSRPAEEIVITIRDPCHHLDFQHLQPDFTFSFFVGMEGRASGMLTFLQPFSPPPPTHTHIP